MRGSGEGVGLAGAGLPVAEDGGAEAVDGHLDELLDARVVKDVRLAGLRLEHHVERERLELTVLALLLVDLRKKGTPN